MEAAAGHSKRALRRYFTSSRPGRRDQFGLKDYLAHPLRVSGWRAACEAVTCVLTTHEQQDCWVHQLSDVSPIDNNKVWFNSQLEVFKPRQFRDGYTFVQKLLRMSGQNAKLKQHTEDMRANIEFHEGPVKGEWSLWTHHCITISTKHVYIHYEHENQRQKRRKHQSNMVRVLSIPYFRGPSYIVAVLPGILLLYKNLCCFNYLDICLYQAETESSREEEWKTGENGRAEKKERETEEI